MEKKNKNLKIHYSETYGYKKRLALQKFIFSIMYRQTYKESCSIDAYWSYDISQNT